MSSNPTNADPTRTSPTIFGLQMADTKLSDDEKRLSRRFEAFEKHTHQAVSAFTASNLMPFLLSLQPIADEFTEIVDLAKRINTPFAKAVTHMASETHTNFSNKANELLLQSRGVL